MIVPAAEGFFIALVGVGGWVASLGGGCLIALVGEVCLIDGLRLPPRDAAGVLVHLLVSNPSSPNGRVCHHLAFYVHQVEQTRAVNMLDQHPQWDACGRGGGAGADLFSAL